MRCRPSCPPFLSALRRRPRSLPLFPYTTLFRSIIVTAHDKGPGIPDISRALEAGFSTSRSLGLGLPGVRRLMDEFEIVSDVDRKSTRLNSSHRCISYAVFCLKKKTPERTFIGCD